MKRGPSGFAGGRGRVRKFMAVNQEAFADSQARYPGCSTRPMLPGNYVVTGHEAFSVIKTLRHKFQRRVSLERPCCLLPLLSKSLATHIKVANDTEIRPEESKHAGE